MKNNFKFSLLFLAMSSVLAAGSAQAAPCQTTDVQVNSISIASGPIVNTNNYSAAECVGAISGNAIPLPKDNFGYAGDGLFNGANQDGKNKSALFPNGIFSDQYTATDLNGDKKPDPGWIYLGSYEYGQGFVTATTPWLQGIVLSDWFNITTNAAGNAGTWAFNLDKDVVSRMSKYIGNNLFDSFALSFMSGDSFAAYDFTAKEFGMPVSSATIFNWSGTWDMSKTLLNTGGNAGTLSHVDLYARDPANGQNNIPEPGSVALLGLGFVSMIVRRRKTA